MSEHDPQLARRARRTRPANAGEGAQSERTGNPVGVALDELQSRGVRGGLPGGRPGAGRSIIGRGRATRRGQGTAQRRLAFRGAGDARQSAAHDADAAAPRHASATEQMMHAKTVPERLARSVGHGPGYRVPQRVVEDVEARDRRRGRYRGRAGWERLALRGRSAEMPRAAGASPSAPVAMAAPPSPGPVGAASAALSLPQSPVSSEVTITITRQRAARDDPSRHDAPRRRARTGSSSAERRAGRAVGARAQVCRHARHRRAAQRRRDGRRGSSSGRAPPKLRRCKISGFGESLLASMPRQLASVWRLRADDCARAAREMRNRFYPPRIAAAARAMPRS